MCNDWFQNNSPTHIFAVDWDIRHVNWTVPFYFNEASPTGSPGWGHHLQHQLACEGFYSPSSTSSIYITFLYLKLCFTISHPYLLNLHYAPACNAHWLVAVKKERKKERKDFDWSRGLIPPGNQSRKIVCIWAGAQTIRFSVASQMCSELPQPKVSTIIDSFHRYEWP